MLYRPKDAVKDGERSQRYESIMKVEYKYKGHTYIDLVDNISRDGLFIATPAPLPVKSHIELFLYPVGKSIPIALTGEVRWVRLKPEKNRKRGMGIAFIGEQQKLLVARLLEEMEAMYSKGKHFDSNETQVGNIS